MHKKPLLHQIVDSQVTKNTQSLFVFKNSTPEADFCINKCPHSDTPCNGYCKEYKEFSKNK